jgi:CRP-like cAMP-binding protein
MVPPRAVEGGEMTVVEALRKLELLNQLDDEELEKLGAIAGEIFFPAGEQIVREGVPLKAIKLVLKGAVMVNRGTEVLARLGAGSLVGELSCIDRGLPSADVWAAEDTKLLRIPFETLDALLLRERELGMKLQQAFLQDLCRKIRATNELLFAQEMAVEEVRRSRVSYL